jgi:2-polyprenyl-3-methyl-5-hydroxy-6-metoxy-1,4-benzoquinol methylase
MSNFYDKFHNKSASSLNIINSNNFTYYYIIKTLNEVVKSYKKNVHILDVGCGTGAIDLYLANLGFKVTGFDISKKAIDIANKNSNLNNFKKFPSFYTKDIQSAIPKKDKYEIIICSEVLEHIKNDSNVIKKLKTSLKKGGSLIITVPSSNAPLYRLGKLSEFDKEVGHLRRYLISDLRSILTKEKLKIVKVRKTEGLARNLLYTNNKINFIIKFIKGPLVNLFHLMDKVSVILFGESQIIIVAKK